MGQTIYRKDYTQPDYWIRHVDLTLDIRDGETFVTSKMQMERNGRHDRPIVLDSEDMTLLGVTVQGSAVPAGQCHMDKESLSFPAPADDTFEVVTRVRIEPEKNTSLMGLYKSGKSWCTQCEPHGFRRITPFVDRPDNMATYTVRIEADKKAGPVLLSNGNLIDKGDLPDGRHFTVWQDPFPKPSYLFAAVGSDLAHIEDTFETMSGRKVQLRIYAEHSHLEKLEFAMQSLKRAMKWDEEKYGREYDLDLFNIVAVDDFNFGAMENKSLNVFNTSAVFAHPFTQTDGDHLSVDRIVAHEYFHNWTGDRITCRDWFQLTLKEGLTVFRDQNYSIDTISPLKRVNDAYLIMASQFAQDSGPLTHPIRPDKYQTPNNFYTVTVYNKGAEVIGMLHTLLGADTYRQATDLYFSRHDGQAVTCDDFLKCMADASGRNLDQFAQWYDRAGTPKLDASWSHDPKTNVFSLTLKQTPPDNLPHQDQSPMHFPVRIGLVDAVGRDVKLGPNLENSIVLEMTKDEETFTFHDILPGAVPSILRGFSAPVKLTAQYTDKDLAHLMKHDSDPFNRTQAARQFLTKRMMEEIYRVGNGFEPQVAPDVIDVFRQIIEDGRISDEFRAIMLSLPSISELKMKCPVVNPKALRDVQKSFLRKIADALTPQFWLTYGRCDNNASYVFDRENVARRSLKNTILSWLSTSQNFETSRIAYKQFQKADNMTDRYAAFAALVHIDNGLRDMAVHDFYEMYRHEPLAIDKWFTLRAASSADDTLQVAKMLMEHPDFKITNPNRVRALFGGFTASPAFHAEDGSGYDFIADLVIKADAINPQLSSRLIDVFSDYRRYAEPWQGLMVKSLERIASIPNMGKDLREKLEKLGVMKPVAAAPVAAPQSQP